MANAIKEAAKRQLRRSGMKPILYVREVWIDTVKTENIESGQAKGGIKFDKKLKKKILTGNEPIELMIF